VQTLLVGHQQMLARLRLSRGDHQVARDGQRSTQRRAGVGGVDAKHRARQREQHGVLARGHRPSRDIRRGERVAELHGARAELVEGDEGDATAAHAHESGSRGKQVLRFGQRAGLS